jgi:hypothetical protein
MRFMLAEIGQEMFVALKLPGLRKDNSKVISTAICSKRFLIFK